MGHGLDVAFMTKVRVMYWKEVPVQIQAADETSEISKPLHPRFQEGVDALAMFDGSAGKDDYLEAWEWGPYLDVEGDALQAASTTAQRYNEGFPKDFVTRIRDIDRAGDREPSPGSIDSWIQL